MYSLFISTFDKLITIGLLKNGEILEKLEKESTRNHSEFVMPMIENILNNNNIDTSYLNEIIVINGPGSFTGVRIGVTIAKTLSYTLNIPAKTIDSLLSFAVSCDSNKNKVITIPDLKGKYVGYFDKDNNQLVDYTYLKNNEFEEFIKGKKNYIIKDNKLDLIKINNYLKNVNPLNSHLVNPIYVKGIDALNDK